MNILYLHCHDAGRYIEPYHPGLKTPHLRELAEGGMLFRQAHCANPTCSPSRACLLTGRCAHANGMLGLAHRSWRLDDYSRTLPAFLSRNGYHTVLSGKQHIARPPHAEISEIGYDEIVTTDAGFEAAAAGAEAFLGRGPATPFFLDVGFQAPHRAGNSGDFPREFPPEDERYLPPPACLPDNPATRRDFALYAASIRSTDRAMGRVLEALRRSGQADNTLVIATTDHGIAFPKMKCRLTDHGTGVFLILRGPGGFDGGKVSDALVSQLDLFPTLCERLGLEAPADLEGRSLAHLADDPSAAHHDAIFGEVNYHAAVEPMRSARTRRWKYIRHYTEDARVRLPNIDNSISKYYLCLNGFAERERPAEELYDLVDDPQESHNRADDPACAETLDGLRQRLDDWMRKTDDPLLRGELPRPDHLVVTPSDDYSAGTGQDRAPDTLPWSDPARRWVEGEE